MSGYTVITGSNLKDISGKPLNGRVTFTGPVNTDGKPLSAIAAGGPMLYGTKTFLVVNGVITGDDAHVQNTASVADTSDTTPKHVGYSVSFFATKLTPTPIPTPGYTCVQPSGASWSLDDYVPAQGTLTVVTPGPAGEQGEQGEQGIPGAVTATGTNGNFLVPGTLSANSAWIPNPQMTGFRSALHNSTSQVASVAVIGDSILCGIGPGNIANSPINQLRSYLNQFGSHGTGLIPIGDNGGVANRPEWALAGTWTTVNDFGPFQASVGAFGTTFTTTGSSTATLAGQTGDTLVIYGESVPGDTGWDVTIDGSTAATAVGAYSSGAASVFRVAVASTLGAHTVVLAPHGGGTAHLYGCEWTIGSTGVAVHNLAHGYARSEAWGSAASQLAYLGLLSPVPDAAIVSLGVNDCINGTGTTSAQYTANMGAILTYLRTLNPRMSILILDEQDLNTVGYPLPQSTIRATEQALAATYSAAYASTADVWGPQATAIALGLMAGDQIHPSDKGGHLIGALLFSALVDHSLVAQNAAGGSPNALAAGTTVYHSSGSYQMKAYPDDLFCFVTGGTVTLPTSATDGETRIVYNFGSSPCQILPVSSNADWNAGGFNIPAKGGVMIRNYAGDPSLWYVVLEWAKPSTGSGATYTPPAPLISVGPTYTGAPYDSSKATQASVYLNGTYTMPSSSVPGDVRFITALGGSVTLSGFDSSCYAYNLVVPAGKTVRIENANGSAYWSALLSA